MSKDQLTYRDEKISFIEKRTLIFRFIGVFIFGALIGGVAFYFLFFMDNFKGFDTILIIFGVFFFAVLALIIFIHGRNAFQTEKRIYSGIITDKSETTTKFRNSLGQQNYRVSLDGEEFVVDLMFYNQVHKGQHIELHCLRNNSIFLVKEVPANENAFSNLEKVKLEVQNIDPAYKSILKRHLLKGIWYRTILLLLPLSVLYFIGFAVIIFAIDDSQLTITLLRVLQLVLAVIYILFNKRIIFILMDLNKNIQVEKIEKVIDLQKSNLPKPGKYSVSTYQGYWYKNDLFYYIQTQNHWLNTNEVFYSSLNAGDEVKIILAKHSKIVLDLQKVS